MDFLVLVFIGVMILILRRKMKLIETRLDQLDARLEGPVKDTGDARHPGPVAKAEPEPEASSPETSPWLGAKVPPPRPTTLPDRPKVEKKPGTQAPGRGADASDVMEQGLDRAGAFLKLLIINWPLALAGVSLALGGVFMVQYGIENGVLGTRMRVAGAVILGVALIFAGEHIRRRFGDETSGPTAMIPSTLSGAGLVALFAAPVAAHALYDLIGPAPALIMTTAVSAAAILLGWFHGRSLVVGGVIGAVLSPALVDGAPDGSGLLLYHQVLIAFTGVSVGAIRRWPGVMALSLALPAWMGWVVYANLPTPGPMSIFALAMAAVAVIIPNRSLTPSHDGTTLTGALSLGSDFPRIETLFAGAGVAFAAVTLLFVGSEAGPTGLLFAAGAAAAGAVAMVRVAPRAPALSDLFAPFALSAIGVLVGQYGFSGTALLVLHDVRDDVAGGLISSLETPPPIMGVATSLLFVGAALGVSLLLLGTYLPRPRLSFSTPVWAPFVPGIPIAAAFALQAFWLPEFEIGRYGWALLVIGAAALLTGAAAYAARVEEGPGPVTGQISAGAAVLIAHALFIMLSHSVLTVALGGLLVAIAAADRAYRLRGFGLLLQAGTVLLGWRFLYDMFEAAPTLYGGALPALASQLPPVFCAAAACALLSDRRPAARITLESGAWGAGAIAASVQVYHLLGEGSPHVSFGLFAVTALVPGFVQLYRLPAGGRVMRWVRGFLATIFMGFGTLVLLARETFFFPVHASSTASETVSGLFPFDTIFAAYLPLIVVLLGGARALAPRLGWVRKILVVSAAANAATVVFLEIRRFWRGPDLSVPGVTQPELYSYTIAMMIAAAGLLMLAWAHGSDRFRRLAMVAAAVTIAKVFLVDMDGLTGLIRVASFVGLGLALAALAWVNRMIRDATAGKTGSG